MRDSPESHNFVGGFLSEVAYSIGDFTLAPPDSSLTIEDKPALVHKHSLSSNQSGAPDGEE
jgi:hypothetical protein